MAVRKALVLLAVMLSGCVTTGDIDPMKTTEGRERARDAFIELGIGYLERGASEQAKAPLQQALDLDPKSANAHMALALAFQHELEHTLAEKHFKQAIASEPGNSRLLNNYAGFLFEQQRYADAHAVFLKASEDTMYSERSRVFENLGLTALQLNEKGSAKHYFTRALRLNSQQPRALLELADLAFQEQDFVTARSYYEGFTQLSAHSARSLLLGVRLANVFDDRSTAASLGLQLRRLYPGTVQYQQYLSELK